MSVHVTPLGHATVLIQNHDFSILTDPVFGNRVGPSVGGLVVGADRITPFPWDVSRIPEISLVLLSHAHWDHTDKHSLKKLSKDAVAIVQPRNEDLVRHFRDRRALPWWSSTEVTGPNGQEIRITSVPAKHWSARWIMDRWRRWGGYLLEFPGIPSPHIPDSPLSILFAGDTSQTDYYAKIREFREGRGVDLALMPIGAYDPWIMSHCNPEQAWQMAMHDLGAYWFVPIHYDAFQLSNEPKGEAMARLEAVAAKEGLSDRIAGQNWGEAFQLIV